MLCISELFFTIRISYKWNL